MEIEWGQHTEHDAVMEAMIAMLKDYEDDC